jgi:hypothetical protein
MKPAKLNNGLDAFSKTDQALVSSSKLFNSEWYLTRYPDVAAHGMDPVRHYVRYGAAEGREPGPAFAARWYLGRYPDVAEAGVNPLVHYLKYGAAEGRAIRPVRSLPESADVGCEESLPDSWVLNSRTAPEVVAENAEQLGRDLFPLKSARITVGLVHAQHEPEINVPTLAQALSQRFGALEPLRAFQVPGEMRRVTMITDGLDAGRLFGGVGTAIVLSTLLARHLGARLRVVTRGEPPNPTNFATILSAQRIVGSGDVDFVYAPPSGGQDVSIGKSEIFLTTSWWTTRCVRSMLDSSRIVYLLQEDERLFYPHGDDRRRCSEVLADPNLRFVINSEILFEHLVHGPEPLPNIEAHGVWFEPAFPAFSEATAPKRAPSGKRQFLFYARPNHLRNLYWRGLEAIGACLEEGILRPDEWELYFVGCDLSDIMLPCGVKPHLKQSLAWPEYARLIRQMDVGLSLMDTPHPSYPPLDLAASGVVAVTNRHGFKTSLARYSDNILCVEPTIDGLKCGIAEAVALAQDQKRRAGNCINQDWQMAFVSVLEYLFPAGVLD